MRGLWQTKASLHFPSSQHDAVAAILIMIKEPPLGHLYGRMVTGSFCSSKVMKSKKNAAAFQLKGAPYFKQVYDAFCCVCLFVGLSSDGCSPYYERCLFSLLASMSLRGGNFRFQSLGPYFRESQCHKSFLSFRDRFRVGPLPGIPS